MKVSVIIPVYNVEDYVEDCIKSVLNQTLQNYEIVCIHDAGTDNSWSKVKALALEDNRIKLLENPENKGLATTRNTGLKKAQGEYVYFLDSDDMIRPDALESLYESSSADDLDIFIFGADFIYETKELEENFRTNPARFKKDYPLVMSSQELYKEWIKYWDWMPSQPRYFYKRDFLNQYEIQYKDGMLHEDETFAFDALMYANRVRVTNEPYFIRRFRSASIMSSVPTMKNIEGCIEILQHVSAFDSEDAELKEAISYYAYRIFRDVVRKYKAVKESGQNTLPSRDIFNDLNKKEIFDQIVNAKELYVCSSYYQVIIALMKAMSQQIKIDMALEVHGIGTAADLADQILKNAGNVVDRVYVCKDTEDVDPYVQREIAADPVLSDKIIKHVEKIFEDNRLLYKYGRINVFWDLGYLGTYLNIRRIYYTLHEDSLNSYEHIRENRPNYAYIFDEEARASHKGVIPFGYSAYCDKVEVNEIEKLQIPLNKVVVQSRKELENTLSVKQKQQIFLTFLSSKATTRVNANSILLLTEPFAITNRLPDENTQVKLYSDILEEYCPEHQVYIKAHPRDSVDYKKYFPWATIIEKNIPIEILNFDEDFSVSKAITVTSSAVHGIARAREKIYLGPEFLRKYQKINEVET